MTSPGSINHECRLCNNVKVPKRKVIFVCQLIATFVIVIVALVNLSLNNHNKELWATLVGAGFGYLVPSPTIRRRQQVCDVTLHDGVAEQQLDEFQPDEHRLEVHDQT